MAKQPKISIIIPLWVAEKRFFRDLLKFDKLEYHNAEILVVSDKFVELPKLHKFKIKLLLTGKEKTGPAEKRDIAINKAKGSICAFIDDDAYPDKNWLRRSVRHFAHPDFAAVCGPGLTPKEDSYLGQVTGLVYNSFFCSGFAQYRFTKQNMQFVDDYPAYNLIVRKDILEKIGGYDNHFYGGEDTFLCLKIVESNYKILYDPEIIIYHHRRELLIPYLKQIANIGKHRGYFFKKFPKTSRKFFYLFPSIFLIVSIIGIILAIINTRLMLPLFGMFITTFVVIGLSLVNITNNITKIALATFTVYFTHFTYGYMFIRGLLTKSMTR